MRRCRFRPGSLLAVAVTIADRDSDRLDLHALDRSVVCDAHAGFCATRLCHAVSLPRRHRRFRRAGRHPAARRAVRHRLVPEQARLLLSRARLPARLVSVVPCDRAVAVRGRARRHPRERGQDHRSRLQYPRLQDHHRGAGLCLRRTRRRALRRVCRLRVTRAVLLADLRAASSSWWWWEAPARSSARSWAACPSSFSSITFRR